MANASVDKLKVLALRHGEKAVMTLTALLCLFLLFTAVSLPTIDLTPDDVKKAAEASQSNLNRTQDRDDILKVLESQKITNPGFEAMVDKQEKNLLVAANFVAPQLWVSPEPGAGLIRDQPELIAPKELYAYPGRGGALVYELDDTGNRIPDPDAGKADDAETAARRKRKRAPLSASSARRKIGEEAKKKEEAKKREIEEKRKIASLAGGGVPKKEDAAATAAVETRMKEKTVGIRWVAITGVLNYKVLRDSYLSALKRPEYAYPHFKQLGVERQVQQSNGSWSDWEAVDQSRNQQILDNLPEADEEYTADNVRLGALVDPLPFLKAGFWERVHVARMVLPEKLKLAQAPAGGAPGMPGMPGDEMAPPPMPVDQGVSQPMDSPAGNMATSYGAPGEALDFEKTEVDEIMIRALDLTVEPDATYRFRVRIVVYNPNLGREDVSPGVDTKSVELFGPWSEPTEEVTMPPDVAAYAMSREPAVPRALDKIKFEVARWTPEDGVTVVKNFPAAPGELIGDFSGVAVPVQQKAGQGKVPVRKQIDFNSHQVVLDVMGGDQTIPPLGPGLAGKLSVPALSLLVRRDGAVVVRSQARDVNDQVRKDMADNYSRELKAAEEEKKKKNPGGPGMMDRAMP